MLAYVCDDALRQSLNRRRMNYWDAYIAEICDKLGLQPEPRSLAALESEAGLAGVETLILGACSGAALTQSARQVVARWVEAGGTLIGFGVEEMDAVFGLEPAVKRVVYSGSYVSVTRIEQGADDWAINGWFNFRSHALTREVHPMLFLEQKLPIVSDICMARLAGAEELAAVFDTNGKLLCLPAITWNTFGKGHAGWFAFDLAKTVWLIQQGRPAPDHPEDGKYPRAHDMSILGGASRLVPYTDEMCWLLQNMIAVKPQPFIHPVPPKDGRPADALLYYGGDEYVGPVEHSIQAAEFMHGLGLPYQTNIESDNHPMTKEEHARIRSLGTEVSAYYHLYARDGYTMTAEHFKFQSDRFFERFGYRPVAIVTHCIRWKGWTEPAKWMLAAGTRADNGFSGKCVPNDNHFRNSAGYGYSFGSCYPRYFWDDWRCGNARIDFMEQPVTCYELGHRSTTSIGRDPDTRAPEELHLAVGMAIKYHLVMNFFYHPPVLATSETAREAVREILRYIAWRNARVAHMNNRMVAEWWDARHASSTRVAALSAEAARFTAECAYDGGMVVKLAVPEGRKAVVAGFPAEVIREFGRDWLHVVLPKGRSDVYVVFTKDVAICAKPT
jgi:hypothetical protein